MGFIFINKKAAAYSNSFGIEYIPQQLLNKIKDKSTTHNILRIPENESMMCECDSISFIEHILARKTL